MGNGIVNPSSNPDQGNWVLLHFNSHGKGMNSSILLLTSTNGFLAFNKQLVEEKENWIKTRFNVLKNWPCVISFPQWRGLGKYIFLASFSFCFVCLFFLLLFFARYDRWPDTCQSCSQCILSLSGEVQNLFIYLSIYLFLHFLQSLTVVQCYITLWFTIELNLL